MTDEALAMDTRRYVPYAIVGGGGLLVAASVVIGLLDGGIASLLTPISLAAMALSVFLGGIVIAAGLTLLRTDMSVERFPRAGYWTLGGATVLLLANAP